MHTQDEQLAASSGGNSALATERINSEGIYAGPSNESAMEPPMTLENHNTTKPTRRNQTDLHPGDLTELRSGSVTDEYGEACEGGLYRPAKPNVVQVRNAGTQTDIPDWDDMSDDDQFAIISDDEDEGVQVEEIEFASRRNSAGYGLGAAGGEAVGGVPPTVMDVLDGINADYEIVLDPELSGVDVLAGKSVRKINREPGISGKRKARESVVEIEDGPAGQQPAMKKPPNY
ncbi:hypothetical protein V492_00513 [Pseudogymnoascus sp. VKM F-4246]|nr:hypothetical protein V492_00513 [Pseudogymnoascus sp. VKM F-4246]